MAMSLDYMGKLVIIMVVIAVSIGIITQFRGQIDDNLDNLDQGEDRPGLEIIEISGPSPVRKISDLVSICYQRSLKRGFEDFPCFLARKDSGSFALDKADLEDNLENEVNQSTVFKQDSYTRDSLVIKYSVKTDKVIVEE